VLASVIQGDAVNCNTGHSLLQSVCKLSSSEDGKKQNQSVPTLYFWKFSECYTNKRIKNPLEIGYQHFKRSPISAYFWLNTNHLRNFRSDCLSQNISCKEINKWSGKFPVVESCFSVGLILEPREGWIVTSSMLTPRQTNRPKRASISMCMEVSYMCHLLGLSLLLALVDFAHM